ncbi:hypothetical protein AK812_SmicGene26631 [Symbiodinium microadriaticum]|uniref:Uncharacterized protein n=1 Tax=Symbiodinium microadriaticum TaxID=2951 RepID=A0A1Q9D8X9_SYMMI|nr:hypothetical protein AK812_SmicGene26631 [Symbiodinium microadriaticum]
MTSMEILDHFFYTGLTRLSHILGLRDFTDQDALTGQKADIDHEDNFGKRRSRRRSQSQPATSGGVIYLELDVERQVVHAASIVAASLETGLHGTKGETLKGLLDMRMKVGMSLLELFPGAGWEAIEWEPEMNFIGDVMKKWTAQVGQH